MNLPAVVLISAVYLAFCGLEVLLRDFIYSNIMDGKSSSYVRKYRRLCHVLWLLLYVYALFAASGLVPRHEAPFLLGLIFIVGIVGFLWIQEPDGRGNAR